MPKWTVTPGIQDFNLKAEIIYDKNETAKMQVKQDIQPYLDAVKRDRENLENNNQKSHYRKFATIPDVVAIEILEKYGLDIHAPTFMKDKDSVKKLKNIIITEYPELIVST